MVQPRQRPRRAGALEDARLAYESRYPGGEPDAWRNLGRVLESIGDVTGALRAYRGAADAGDLEGGMQLALLLPDQGEAERAFAVAEELAAAGYALAGGGAGVLALVRDPRRVARGRRCAPVPTCYPPARKDLADLLRHHRPRGRGPLGAGARREARRADTWLPLGNFYADEMRDEEAAEEAYRAGIAAGDIYCHHNLGMLLAERGDLEGAVEQFRLGAAAGDEMAVEALRDLGVRLSRAARAPAAPATGSRRRRSTPSAARGRSRAASNSDVVPT